MYYFKERSFTLKFMMLNTMKNWIIFSLFNIYDYVIKYNYKSVPKTVYWSLCPPHILNIHTSLYPLQSHVFYTLENIKGFKSENKLHFSIYSWLTIIIFS